jgi:hypothetical protein
MSRDLLIRQQARDDFNRARAREVFFRILNAARPERHELLSLKEVRSLLRPTNETYRGMQVVPVDLIVGSEGRYRDFNKAYLPRHEHMRHRWEHVDRAHLASVILPPIRLYEIGGVYFVRDGNHRVSVARSQGVERIDAEVVALSTEVPLRPDMSMEALRREVINYEKTLFFQRTGIRDIFTEFELDFTATGRYDDIVQHIEGHKYYINQGIEREITFREAAESWHEHVYLPICRAIVTVGLATRFPGRTVADLYVWIVRHWDELKQLYGDDVSVDDAARDFSRRYGKGLARQIRELLQAVLRSLRRR